MSVKIIIGVISLFVFYSCTKESGTAYSAHMVNASAHTIEIRPFFRGQMPPERVIKIAPQTTVQIAVGSYRGIVNQTGFISEKLSGADSIQVIYDERFIVSHYLDTPVPGARRYYLNTPPRNVLNVNSYVYEFKNISKHSRQAKYTYTFTEQDYLYAQ